ncbi:helix-turn-helix domain-containing protein [Paraburkholderia solisilvae]|uniref:helix-turn-helix domain-containing protein n=1 Tax=Paraburkholderia solisilvae TaxID=624376 RepID=UPI00158244D7|nr:helix-turn-helix transcriptional regulator [Paraburkholderia solisilvae]
MAHPLHDPRNQRIAVLLTEIRRQRGLLQLDLAERLGRPQSFVSRYESGGRRLDLTEVMDVLKALEFDVHEFIDQLESSGPPQVLPR